MTCMTSPTSIPPAELPAPIRTFLTAHADRDAQTAITAFGDDAVVTDQGQSFRGTTEVLDFLRHAGAEFTYTSELTGAERVDGEHWVAHIRLEGDFPGGEANLGYRFTLEGDCITELEIGG